ncbi:MAG: GntR family transcriptional regulator [Atribacterota bacterium]|nr:GntR family transcriptional regulator [Atribacterota bacterium]MDD4895808.1 GntR family transcriptional regulator [Atribacterota bacterium]MDD5637445.1 GntR family transcriptional regulator [Atribacterota bacterium]
MNNLDKNSPIPLYFQLAELIKAKIKNGEWKINDAIPSELKLCMDFQISRGTVRQAINCLIQEGYLFRKQGLGTFVSDSRPKYVNPVSSFYCVGFKGKNHDIGIKRKIISKNVIRPNYKIKEIMNLKNEQLIYHIKGILFLDDIPISLEEFFLLKGLFPNLKPKYLATMAPYEVFMRKYNLSISEVQESFTIKKINQKISDRLKLQEGAYALVVNRIARTDNNVVFEYRQSIIRTDKCSYTVILP